MTDLREIVQVTGLPDFTLHLCFNNGDCGELRLPNHLSLTGYFTPLAHEEFFEEVYIDHGTICWPGGIDLDPFVVHAWTMNVPIELASATPA